MPRIGALAVACCMLAALCACVPPKTAGESTWDWWRRTHVRYSYDLVSVPDTGKYDASTRTVHVWLGAIDLLDAKWPTIGEQKIRGYVESHEAGHAADVDLKSPLFTVACMTGCEIGTALLWLERGAECATQAARPDLASMPDQLGWDRNVYWPCPAEWLAVFRLRMIAAGMIDP
jgi:hypothetical protein